MTIVYAIALIVGLVYLAALAWFAVEAMTAPLVDQSLAPIALVDTVASRRGRRGLRGRATGRPSGRPRSPSGREPLAAERTGVTPGT